MLFKRTCSYWIAAIISLFIVQPSYAMESPLFWVWPEITIENALGYEFDGMAIQISPVVDPLTQGQIKTFWYQLERPVLKQQAGVTSGIKASQIRYDRVLRPITDQNGRVVGDTLQNPVTLGKSTYWGYFVELGPQGNQLAIQIILIPSKDGSFRLSVGFRSILVGEKTEITEPFKDVATLDLDQIKGSWKASHTLKSGKKCEVLHVVPEFSAALEKIDGQRSVKDLRFKSIELRCRDGKREKIL